MSGKRDKTIITRILYVIINVNRDQMCEIETMRFSYYTE